MPETGALIGTPASISASVEPQTEPIDDEPFDSSVSETIRIVYGKSAAVRDDGLERPLGERAVADVAAARAGHPPRLPHRVRREVVVVDVAAVLLERQVVDPLTLLGGAEGEQRHDLRLPAGEERRAVRARADRHLARRSGGSRSPTGRRAGACRPRSSCGRGPCRSTRPPCGHSSWSFRRARRARSPRARPGTGSSTVSTIRS